MSCAPRLEFSVTLVASSSSPRLVSRRARPEGKSAGIGRYISLLLDRWRGSWSPRRDECDVKHVISRVLVEFGRESPKRLIVRSPGLHIAWPETILHVFTNRTRGTETISSLIYNTCCVCYDLIVLDDAALRVIDFTRSGFQRVQLIRVRVFFSTLIGTATPYSYNIIGYCRSR